MDSAIPQILNNINASIISRFAAFLYIDKNPKELFKAVEFATDFKHKNHHKAIWILETIAERTPIQLVPHIDAILNSCPNYKHESAVRGISRILYFVGVSEDINLKENQNEKLIEACIDVLIGNAKVAPKVYAMYTLSFYAKQHGWVKEELQNIINKDFAHQSAGYKAAARVVLLQLSK